MNDAILETMVPTIGNVYLMEGRVGYCTVMSFDNGQYGVLFCNGKFRTYIKHSFVMTVAYRVLIYD